jgi:hypothetical protein
MPVLLQIGTAPNKNILRLIDSIVNINCKLVIVGKLSSDILSSLKLNSINYDLYDFRLTDEEIENLYMDRTFGVLLKPSDKKKIDLNLYNIYLLRTLI